MEGGAEHIRVLNGRSGVVELWLNRPQKRNALTPGMIADLLAAVRRFSVADDGGALMLAAEGPAFCAGGDVSFVQDRSAIQQRDMLELGFHALARACYQLDKPFAVAVNGAAVGAGVDLTLFADVSFASPLASFDLAYPRIGLVPGDSAAWFLPRRVGHKALELAWRQQPTGVEEAQSLGLVDRIVPHEDLHEACRTYLRELLGRPGTAVARTKRILRRCEQLDLDTALDLMAAEQALMHDTPARRAAARGTPDC